MAHKPSLLPHHCGRRRHRTGRLFGNTHGLDEEGWGPIRATYLEDLLERWLSLDTMEILPAGLALVRAQA